LFSNFAAAAAAVGLICPAARSRQPAAVSAGEGGWPRQPAVEKLTNGAPDWIDAAAAGPGA